MADRKGEKKRERISVRSLVEFLLRSGDLDNRGGGWADKEAMQQGSRIHRKLQKRMVGGYQAEVPLRFEKEYENFILIVEGRADGIFTDQKGTVIDEIKGVYQNLEQLEEPVPVHLAQAKCYAYVYGLQQKLEQIRVQMTYCNMDTEEVRKFVQDFRMEELDLWFSSLLDSYYKWADFQVCWERKRDASMEEAVVCPGCHRNRQDHVSSVPGGSRPGRGIWRENLLFNGKDDYPDGGGGGIFRAEGAGAFLQSSDHNCQGENVCL